MKKIRKDAMGIVKTGVTLGVGSSVLSSVGSTDGSKAKARYSIQLLEEGESVRYYCAKEAKEFIRNTEKPEFD